MIKTKDKKVKLEPKATFEEKISKGVGSIVSLYIHTALFLFSFFLMLLGVPADRVLLILTTIVSLEAIYLAIFIQMTVNKNTESLEEVEEDLDEIQEDIDEIQEDIDEIEEEVDDIEEGDNKRDRAIDDKFKDINNQLQIILEEIKSLRNNNK